MNENGGSVQSWITAGGDGGANVEVRHGTLFPGHMTVTHVCVAVRTTAGPVGRISFRHPDPNNLNLPDRNVEVYGQDFTINPQGDTQTIALAQPVHIPGPYWLTVEYPDAVCNGGGGGTCQVGTGHQGVREKKTGHPMGAIFIDNPQPPSGPWSGIDGWYWNDASWLPSWMADMVPIIRAFSLGPCTWCSFGSSMEIEPCGTDANNGCDGGGGSSPIFCNSTHCATLWQDGPLVDVDWWSLDVVDLFGNGFSTVTIEIDSEIELEVRLQNTDCPGDPGYMDFGTHIYLPCTDSVTFAVPSPGSYYVVVRPASPGVFPPGTGCLSAKPYIMHVDVDTCFTGPGNSWCSSPDQVGYVQQMPFNNINAVTDGPPEPSCGFTGADDSDVWFEFTATVDGLHVVTIDPTGPPMDSNLAVYHTGCPQHGFPLLACDSAVGPASSSVSFQSAAGETFYIRAGTPGGAAGQNWFLLTIDVVTSQPCPEDISGPAGAPDGVVDGFDLLAVLGAWGPCPAGPCPEDLSGPAAVPDGVVDGFDLLAVLGAWGPCP